MLPVLVFSLGLLSGCGNTQSSPSSSTNKLPGVKPFESADSYKDKNVQIVAFGDFGRVTRSLISTMKVYHDRIKAPHAVFLLGDNSYQPLSSPSEYESYFSYVARDSRAPHYVILGNHDYMNKVDGFMLKMPSVDPRWIMPSRFYFHRFEREDFTICVWFLDTYKFTREQTAWLSSSIKAEKSSCTWTIVNGHHPGMVHASGAKYGSAHIDRYLQPILNEHDIDIYLCGHHHNSQHLTNIPYKTHVFVVGQVMSAHSFDNKISKGQLVWGSGSEPAILELNIKAESIDFAFHSGSRGSQAPPIHTGTIVH